MTKQINFKFKVLTSQHLRRFFCLLSVIGTLFSASDLMAQKKSGATKFASVYTDSTKQCKGAEPVFTCKGYGDYTLILNIGGVFQSGRIESAKNKDYSLSIANRQSVGWNPKVEWRTANGKPFAVIVRVDENDENAETPKKIGEKLMVFGLQGYEHISYSIDAKTANANVKAREIADKGFSGGNASLPKFAVKNSGEISSIPLFSGDPYDAGKTALLSDEQIKKLGALNAAVAVPTYVPAGYKIKNVEIQESEAHIVAFSMIYEDASGKSFTIQSHNEALGDTPVKEEVKGSNDLFLPLSRAVKTTGFYAGHEATNENNVATEWLCSIGKYQSKESKISQCFQLLSDSKSVSPAEAVKIMSSLRYLKR